MQTVNTKKNVTTMDLSIYALLIALVFLSTYIITVPMPFSQGGLIHIGDVMLFTSALVFGEKKGAIAGGFGMFLFDVLSPYAVWAPFTLVIKGLMGYLVGKIAFSNGYMGNNKKMNIIAIFASLPVLIIGYYIAEALIYGNWITPINSVPGNLWQFAFGLVGGLPLSMILNGLLPIKKYKGQTIID